MTAAATVPQRADIALEETWNNTAVFPDHDAWQAEYEAVTQEINGLSRFSGTLGDSPDSLADWIETSSMIRRRGFTLYFYALMENSVNALDDSIKPLIAQAGGMMGAYQSTTAFAEPEILAIDEDTLRTWIAESPRLQPFEHYFMRLLDQKPHVRSAEVEEVLGMAADTFNTMRRIGGELTGTDMTFAPAHTSDGDDFEITQSTIDTAKDHPDRSVRRTGWQNYADSYQAYQNTLATAYITSVKQNVFNARVRGYDSVLHSMLSPHNIPVEVFHNLIDTCRANVGTWHRYWDIKRHALNLDEMKPWDIWAPLVEKEPSVSFEQAVDWISEGMTPLGEDYVATLRKGCLEERWVDRAVNRGKRQGAFSFGSYDTAPYIMMSFDGNLKAMSTLAHELGHSMHSFYSRQNQPEPLASYSMFVAEVASNFNQALTRAYLFETQADADFQITLIEEAMSNFHRYFFIMPTLARFEFEVHQRAEQGKPLSADILNGIMRDLYAEGYGDTLSDDPERTGITWSQFGHLYTPYYTFQYATGISAAHALADRILRGEDNARDNYRKFLTLGGAVYPIDALKIAGVDMTTPEPVERAFSVLDDLVNRLAKLTR